MTKILLEKCLHISLSRSKDSSGKTKYLVLTDTFNHLLKTVDNLTIIEKGSLKLYHWI